MLAIAVLIPGLVGCGDNQPKSSLKIGLMPDIGVLPILVAKEEGFFNDCGVDIELLFFKSAQDRDAALQSAQLDGALSDLLAVYFFNSNNIRVKAASITESRFLILGSERCGLKRLEDLNDVELGLSLSTVTEYFVEAVLSEKELKARYISIPQVVVRMELFRSGQLKAVALPDPLATALTKGGANILADSRELKIDPVVLIFTGQFIVEHSGTLRAFYQAYNQAVYAINREPEKYRQLLLTKGQFPQAIIDDISIPYFRVATLPAKKEVEQILLWAKEKGFSKGELSYSSLVIEGLY